MITNIIAQMILNATSASISGSSRNTVNQNKHNTSSNQSGCLQLRFGGSDKQREQKEYEDRLRQLQVLRKPYIHRRTAVVPKLDISIAYEVNGNEKHFGHLMPLGSIVGDLAEQLGINISQISLNGHSVSSDACNADEEKYIISGVSEGYMRQKQMAI